MIRKGEYWRRYVLEEVIPNWYNHAIDKEYGAYYLNLTKDWKPVEPWDKMPAMISRNIFGFSAAYLLSGEDKYLDSAAEGVKYLLEKGWDKKFGGWFDELDREGNPKSEIKSIPLQLYTNVGLTLYYIVTGDEKVISHVIKSVDIQKTNGWDPEHDGYCGALNRDLSVADNGKNKHSHYGYVGSLVLNMWLATRENSVLEFEKKLTDLTIDKMLDENGWVCGASNLLNRQWEPQAVYEHIAVGAQLTAALSFLRLYHHTGDKKYLDNGLVLSEKLNTYGWDEEKHAWLDHIEKKPPFKAGREPVIFWWNQIYGAFLQLQLYHITGIKEYLDRFEKTEKFYLNNIVDKEYAGAYTGVTLDGKVTGKDYKAMPWHAAYHEMEHGLLNYLYLNLYVDKTPATLFFRISNNDSGRKHYVTLLDDLSFGIKQVKINGSAWNDFNGEDCSISLPVGDDLKIEVTF